MTKPNQKRKKIIYKKNNKSYHNRTSKINVPKISMTKNNKIKKKKNENRTQVQNREGEIDSFTG